MIYLIISILCSVTVGVLLKVFRRYQIDFKQVLAINYLTALLLAQFIFNPGDRNPDQQEPELLYILLGFLLPGIFFFLNRSVLSQGLARTDVAQRLSLIIPLLAAWLLFGENFSALKVFALLIGIAGVALVLWRSKSTQEQHGSLLFPLMVFFGFGLIDILFKQVALLNAVPYTTALSRVFSHALIISMVMLVLSAGNWRNIMSWRGLAAGLVLGGFNFSNILFYLKAHRHFSENPSTVFAGMNLGVIVLGSLIGIFVFKEKFARINYLGMALALLAVALIAIAQKYAL